MKFNRKNAEKLVRRWLEKKENRERLGEDGNIHLKAHKAPGSRSGNIFRRVDICTKNKEGGNEVLRTVTAFPDGTISG